MYAGWRRAFLFSGTLSASGIWTLAAVFRAALAPSADPRAAAISEFLTLAPGHLRGLVAPFFPGGFFFRPSRLLVLRSFIRTSNHRSGPSVARQE